MATEYASLVFRVDSSQLAKANAQLDRVEKESMQADRATGKLNKTFDRTGASARLLSRGIGLLTAALSVRQIVQYADAWTNLENRIKLTTDSTEELTQAQSDLFEIAQGTRQSLESTVQLYQRIAVNAERLGISYNDLLGITETINQAMAVSGATAQESAAAIIQLGQALGSGELRGEELRSVMEQAPRLRDALVDGLGIDGVGALRDLAEAGELTSERVIAALQSQAKVINEEFSGMEVTVGSAASVLNNSFVRLIGTIDEAAGVTSALSSAMMGLSDAIDEIEDNDINRVTQIVGALVKLSPIPIDETAHAWQFLIDKVNGGESEGALERLQAFQRAIGGTDPFSGMPSSPLPGLGGEGFTPTEKPASASILPQTEEDDFALGGGSSFSTVEGYLDSIKELKRVAQETELVDAKDHAAKMAEIDREYQEQKMAGYQMLLDGASAYFSGMEGKQAAYARAALSIGGNLFDEEKREALGSMWAKTGSAAMGAYNALANIPIIGPALGAAAYAGVYATGVATAGKMATGGRELGGQVLPNNSYIVGERGPEVLTMGSTAGNVSQVPMQAEMNKQPQEIVINQNIQSVDAKSVQEVLFNSKDYIASIINDVMNDRGMAL